MQNDVRKTRPFVMLMIAIGLGQPATPALAQRNDQDQAYQDFSRGRIMSLPQIVSRARGAGVEGQHVGTEYLGGGNPLYRLTFRTRDGRQIMVDVDAQSGDVRAVRGR